MSTPGTDRAVPGCVQVGLPGEGVTGCPKAPAAFRDVLDEMASPLTSSRLSLGEKPEVRATSPGSDVG